MIFFGNVLKNIGLIIGDCAVDENGEERADWIMHIIYQLVVNSGIDELKAIYSFSRGLCKDMEVSMHEQGNRTCQRAVPQGNLQTD